MAKVANQAVKEYLINITSNVLDRCLLFSKVFGENFTRNSLEKNLSCVYTNGKREVYEAYANYEDNSITICSGMKETLKPEDIEKNKKLKAKIVHEGSHIALAKSHEECKANGTKAETGMCTLLEDGREIGIGLNEGLTIWILKKSGFPVRNLRKFEINLLYRITRT